MGKANKVMTKDEVDLLYTSTRVLAYIAELEADLKEAKMQSLADLGQAQEAYEAQQKAEAEIYKLKEIIKEWNIDYLSKMDL